MEKREINERWKEGKGIKRENKSNKNSLIMGKGGGEEEEEIRIQREYRRGKREQGKYRNKRKIGKYVYTVKR